MLAAGDARVKPLYGYGRPGRRDPGGTAFGLDGLMGIAPGVGDAAGLALSSFIILEAWRMGAPAPILLRMIGNVVVDSAVGSVPIAGDLFDVVWKTNIRNMELLLRHARGRRRPRICSCNVLSATVG